MIKRNLAIFCMLIASSHASLTYKGIPEENYIEEGKKFPAVCKIDLLDNKGEPFHGSGTLCEDLKGNKFILTCGHIVDHGDLNYADNKVAFLNGFSGHIINMKIFQDYYDPENTKIYLDVGLIFLNKYPDDIKAMKIGIPDFEEKEEKNVKAVGYGTRGIYDHTGRGHFMFYSYKKNESRAIDLRVRKDSTFTRDKNLGSLEKVFDPTQSFPLEGGISSGSSGGPIIYKGETIAVIAFVAKDLIHLEAPTGAPVYRALTNTQLHDGCIAIESFLPFSAKMYFRQTAQWFFNLPDFSVRAFQYMTLLTPKIQEWIYKTVDEVNR